MKKKMIGIYLEDDIIERLNLRAKANQISLSSYLREIVLENAETGGKSLGDIYAIVSELLDKVNFLIGKLGLIEEYAAQKKEETTLEKHLKGKIEKTIRSIEGKKECFGKGYSATSQVCNVCKFRDECERECSPQ